MVERRVEEDLSSPTSILSVRLIRVAWKTELASVLKLGWEIHNEISVFCVRSVLSLMFDPRRSISFKSIYEVQKE